MLAAMHLELDNHYSGMDQDNMSQMMNGMQEYNQRMSGYVSNLDSTLLDMTGFCHGMGMYGEDFWEEMFELHDQCFNELNEHYHDMSEFSNHMEWMGEMGEHMDDMWGYMDPLGPEF